jgi:hypothetical protein
VFYIQLAEGFARHDIEAGLGKLRLNTYPPVLALLHQAGLDWESAGKCWGVFISSMAVLPLFGWVRRQFDDRLAAIACLLYAVHPKLVEWSPELVRDQTFWFLWTMSLYSCWRAACEVRWTWHMAAGVTIALALHTRFEGWCLYLPLLWWSACRWLALTEFRRAIASRLAVSFAFCPLLIWSVNVVWLAGEPRWELGNFTRLEYVALWLHSAVGGAPSQPAPTAVSSSAASAPAAHAGNDGPRAAREAKPYAPGENDVGPTPALATSGAAAPPARMSNGRLLWLFVNALRRGIGTLFGPLWLVGFASAIRTWLRRDQVVLFLVAGIVVAGIWIHLWYAQATSSRYFLTLVLIAAPCAACGCLRLCEFVSRLLTPRAKSLSRYGQAGGTPTPQLAKLLSPHLPDTRPATRLVPLAGVLLLLSVCGMGEALADRHDGRRRDAALGHWLLAEFGPGLHLTGSAEIEVLAYYAHGSVTLLATETLGAPECPANPPHDLAVLSRHGITPERFRESVACVTAAGYQPIDAARLPPPYDWNDLVVLKR